MASKSFFTIIAKINYSLRDDIAVPIAQNNLIICIRINMIRYTCSKSFVLCHAEFEDYLEQLANRLIEEGKQKWLREGVANKNIASLFMNSEKMKPSTPKPNLFP